MNKVHAFMGRCTECSAHGASHTVNLDKNEEMSVCQKCGAVVFRRKFDSLRFMIDEIHDGVDTKEGLRDQLELALSRHYNWLDWVDVEMLAGMLVENLAEEAFFQAEAEDEEAADDYYEREEARMGAY